MCTKEHHLQKHSETDIPMGNLARHCETLVEDMPGAGQNIPGQNIPCHYFTPRTKHPTKICHPGQNIPSCFCHPGHNIPCHFCHPGHNIPCHFCHPGQNIPYSDCFFRVSLICDLHLLWHVLAVNALVWLSKWYKLDLKLIERQFHNVNRI